LLFQSIAGAQKAKESFGVSLSMLREGRERVLEHHQRRGENRVIGSSDDHPSPPKPGGPGTPGDRVIGRDEDTSADHRITRSPDHPIPNLMYFETGQGSPLSA